MNRQRQPHAPDDERQRIARAREAAEALFAAKPAVEEHPSAPTPPTGEEKLRKPRVLAVVPAVAARPDPDPAPAPPRRRPRSAVPRSQHARIRTWIEYGMTAAEVAGVYGTAVGEIERILRKA